MKATIVTRITIAASQGSVFNYLTDLKYVHLWNPQIRSVSSTHKVTAGSSYKTVSRVLGVNIEATNEVVAYVPNKFLAIENNTGTVHYNVNYRLEPSTKSGTILRCTTTVSSDNKAFAFSKPVLQLLAKRELQSDLQALKIAVENNLKPVAVDL